MKRSTQDLLLTIRGADPLEPTELDAWSERQPYDPVLAHLASSEPLPTSGHRMLLPLVVGAAVAALGTAGVAVASGLLGGPAPDPVKAHLAELDRGMPADLRNNPDLDGARAVAETRSGVLYLADLADGGYCLEVASPRSQPRGVSCVRAARLVDVPIDVIAPIPSGDGPLLLGGRVNRSDIVMLRVRFADGVATPVEFGLDRAWLIQVPETERASVLATGLTVEGVDASGAMTSTLNLPAMRDDDPSGTAHDADQPLVLTTISDGADFTRLLGIEGRINAQPPNRLEVRYPDGTTSPVAVAADGSFRFRFPAAREGDFARTAGSLVVLRGGRVVASRPIGSVAYWRGRNG